MPYQCFINGQFEDAENGKTYNTVSPTDGSVGYTHVHVHILMFSCYVWPLTFVFFCLVLQVICKVAFASVADVDRAVAAAKEAFETGPWGKMNPRDRGRLLYK